MSKILLFVCVFSLFTTFSLGLPNEHTDIYKSHLTGNFNEPFFVVGENPDATSYATTYIITKYKSVHPNCLFIPKNTVFGYKPWLKQLSALHYIDADLEKIQIYGDLFLKAESAVYQCNLKYEDEQEHARKSYNLLQDIGVLP